MHISAYHAFIWCSIHGVQQDMSVIVSIFHFWENWENWENWEKRPGQHNLSHFPHFPNFPNYPNLWKNKISKSRVNQYTWSSCCFSSSHRTCCVAACLGGLPLHLVAVATEDRLRYVTCNLESQYKSWMHMLQPSAESNKCVPIASSMCESLFIHAHAENKSRLQNAYRLQARRPFYRLQHSRLPTKIISPPPSPSSFPHPHPHPPPKIPSP
jgi:hypothetical protein